MFFFLQKRIFIDLIDFEKKDAAEQRAAKQLEFFVHFFVF